jgi:hypothetical protein
MLKRSLAMKSTLKSLCASISFGLATMALVVGCKSNPHKAEDLNTDLEKRQNISEDASIGIKDGNMVYQRKVYLGEELRTTTVSAHELESILYGGPRYFNNNGMIGSLKICREKLAVAKKDTLQWTEKRDYVIPENDTFSMGVDEAGVLAGVTEEFLKDRLTRYQRYKAILQNRIDEMDEKISQCNVELKKTEEHSH